MLLIRELLEKFRVVKAKVLNCHNVGDEFECQPLCYVHLRTNILDNGVNLLIPSAMIK